MERALSILCDFLIRQDIIQEGDREVYEYCFAILLMNVLYYLICFLVMIHYHCFLLPIIFTAIFLFLRSYMGGWHAPNMWSCLLFGLLLFTVAVNLMIYPDITEQGKLFFSGFSLLLAGWSVHHFGIQDHPNRRLNSLEKATAQKKCYMLLAILGLLMLCATFLGQLDIVFSAALACFASTALLLLAKFQEKGTMNYETQ